jgi:hypothetical protein
MVWDRHKTVAGLNQLIGSPLFITGSVTVVYYSINDRKTCTDLLPHIKITYYHK